MTTSPEPPRTAGFGVRLAATLFDVFLVFAFIYGPLMLVFGSELGMLEGLVDLALMAFTVWMWQTRGGTPGKMLLGLRVVDATTLRPLGLWQAIGRYFAYLVSMLPVGLGFVWIFFDARHQAWHDKLAGSLVIHAPRRQEETAEAPAPVPDQTVEPARAGVIQPG